MNKHILFLISFICSLTFAQKVDINFGPTKKLKARDEGAVYNFVGVTTDKVFAINKAITPLEKNKFFTLVAYDKKTLAESARLSIFGENSAERYKMRNADLLGTCFNDKQVMLVFKNRIGKGDDFEIFASVYDTELNQVIKQTEIIKIKEFTKRFPSRELMDVVLRQSIDKKDCALIMEFGNGQDKDLTFGIVQFDFTLEKFSTASSYLPVKQLTKRVANKISGTYYFPGDGYVYARHLIQENDDRSSKFWKNGKSKVVINRYDPEDEIIEQFELVDEKYSLTDMRIISNGAKTKIVGLYRDPTKLAQGDVSHGVFTVDFNERSKELNDIVFSPFDATSFDQMFHRTVMSDRKQRKAERKAERNGQELDDNKTENALGDLVVDDLKMDEEGNIVLFVSLMYNYTVQRCTTMNGIQTCYTDYYCQRSDINAIHISPKNEMLYTEHLERNITYPYWYAYDVSASQSGDKFYIYYGDAGTVTERKENRKKMKEKGASSFQYAVLDTKMEQISRETADIIQISNKKKFRRQVDPTTIGVFEGEVYSYSLVPRMGLQAIPSCLLILPFLNSGSHPEYLYNFYGTLVQMTPKFE